MAISFHTQCEILGEEIAQAMCEDGELFLDIMEQVAMRFESAENSKKAKQFVANIAAHENGVSLLTVKRLQLLLAALEIEFRFSEAED
jgi:hypothetical protein